MGQPWPAACHSVQSQAHPQQPQHINSSHQSSGLSSLVDGLGLVGIGGVVGLGVVGGVVGLGVVVSSLGHVRLGLLSRVLHVLGVKVLGVERGELHTGIRGVGPSAGDGG